MDLKSVEARLVELRTKAANLNSQLCSDSFGSLEEKKSAKKEYMSVSAEIAAARLQKHNLILTAKNKPNDGSEGDPVVRIKLASLYFPKEQRAQYLATELDFLDLLVMLTEVFEDSVPVVSCFFSVPASNVADIPPGWYDLISNKKPDGS